jgi:hypothetical protein
MKWRVCHFATLYTIGNAKNKEAPFGASFGNERSMKIGHSVFEFFLNLL